MSDIVATQPPRILTSTASRRVPALPGLSPSQQVAPRLAAGCQLLGLILVLCIPTATSNQPGIYCTTSSPTVRAWRSGGPALFLIASAVLVGTSVYSFVRPLPVKS